MGSTVREAGSIAGGHDARRWRVLLRLAGDPALWPLIPAWPLLADAAAVMYAALDGGAAADIELDA